MKTNIIALPCATILFGFLAAAASAQQFYGLSSDTPAKLYTINAATGAATSVVAVDPSLSTSITGLGTLGGKLYACDVFDTNNANFGSIDPVTGAFTLINTQGGSINWFALAANTSANLFYTQNNDSGKSILETVTPAGAIGSIGATGHSFGGMAYDNANSILYGEDGNNLYTVNTSTGASQLVGSLGLSGLQFDSDITFDDHGVLYLNDGDAHKLYTVNTGTGAATLVGSNGVTATIDGLTFFTPAVSSVPEPGSVALLVGMAGVGIGFLRKRRK